MNTDRSNLRRGVRFVLDGEPRSVDDFDSNRTLLQYLREDLQRTGTKEGCAEGDCGACTVVVGELHDDQIRYRAVNACIQFLPTLDGKALFTVESLSGPGLPLHPVQQAMVDCHGSQCGFCTPGFVMSLFALYKSESYPGRRAVDDALAGNLCRCTGYRPIVEAARRMYELGSEIDADALNVLTAPVGSAAPDDATLISQLRSIQPDNTLSWTTSDRKYFAPHELSGLLSLAADYPHATLLAGGTDVGLWVTKQHRELMEIVYVGNVAELKRVALTDTHLEIGAAVPLSDALPRIVELYPEFEELMLRFASPPIRNSGTLGGNIANGSPIGDTMPALIAVGASIVLSSTEGSRELALEDLYIDFRRTARRPEEVLERIRIPLRGDGVRTGAYKISKRFDQDISAVCAGFSLRLVEGRADRFRAAFGGLAAIPKRATVCESTMAGKPWNEATVQAGMAALDQDFTPMTDMRASEAYRRRVMKNLLYRFYLATAGQQGDWSAPSDVAAQTSGVYAYGR